jgi:protein-disulfide isomerase
MQQPITRRRALATIGATAATLSGCFGGGSEAPTGTVPSSPVVSAPLPGTPSEYTYAAMGDGDAPVTATYFGNWKCPFCADFSTGGLGELVTDYVETGDVVLRYRALAYVGDQAFLGPDAPRAARAGLAVWNVEPETYWAFHEYVMANQPPESKEWATTDTLVTMAGDAGVSDPEAVRDALENDDYQQPVSRTTTAAENAGVEGTPALVVGDRVVNPLETEAARELLDDALASATTTTGG